MTLRCKLGSPTPPQGEVPANDEKETTLHTASELPAKHGKKLNGNLLGRVLCSTSWHHVLDPVVSSLVLIITKKCPSISMVDIQLSRDFVPCRIGLPTRIRIISPAQHCQDAGNCSKPILASESVVADFPIRLAPF
jgi:hypothetical protein